MAVCNLFNKLTSPTGTFLMFSQYTEDLTRQDAHGHAYRVTPSSFLACNMDFSKIDLNRFGEDLNVAIPKFFQDMFENGCAVGSERVLNWNPINVKNLFWNTLRNNSLITTRTIGKNKIINEIMYKGIISDSTYDKVSGMGYSGTYCYIPNGTCRNRYSFENLDIDNIKWDKFEYPQPDDYMWNQIGRPNTSGNNRVSPFVKTIYKYGSDNWNIKYYDALDEGFSINCILVFYDIDNTNYKNIPMGIYFPGIFSRSQMQNIINISYNGKGSNWTQGNSYGVRICSRMTPNPVGDVISTQGSFNETQLGELNHLLSAMADSMDKVNEVLECETDDLDIIKDTMNIFQNSRTNVPYVKKFGDKCYWFVNGRNTGEYFINGDSFGECSDKDIENLFVDFMLPGGYYVEIYCCDVYGIESYEACNKLFENKQIRVRIRVSKAGVDCTSDVRSIDLYENGVKTSYNIIQQMTELGDIYYVLQNSNNEVDVKEGSYQVNVKMPNITIGDSEDNKIILNVKRYSPMYMGMWVSENKSILDKSGDVSQDFIDFIKSEFKIIKSHGDSFDIVDERVNISPQPYNKIYISGDTDIDKDGEIIGHETGVNSHPGNPDTMYNNYFIYLVPDEYDEFDLKVINNNTMDNITRKDVNDCELIINYGDGDIKYKLYYIEDVPFGKPIDLSFVNDEGRYSQSFRIITPRNK